MRSTNTPGNKEQNNSSQHNNTYLNKIEHESHHFIVKVFVNCKKFQQQNTGNENELEILGNKCNLYIFKSNLHI